METVLVLNSDYSPLNVTTLRRGFVLVDKGKAEILKKGDEDIITTIGNFVRPLVIRLLNYVRYRSKGVKVSRKRVFRRDGHECGYCGSKKNLTLDHILPKSRGGLNTWENMVTCCSRCNSLKDNRTPVIVELNEVQVVNGELLPIVVGIPVTPILTVPT